MERFPRARDLEGMTDTGLAYYRSAALGRLGEEVEGLQDIAQCIHIILSLVPGDVPLHPELGWDGFALLDRPLPKARRALIRAALRALKANEPRIDPPTVTAVFPTGTTSALALVVTWKPKGGDQSVVQSVWVGAAA